jgi:hypothetical protein
VLVALTVADRVCVGAAGLKDRDGVSSCATAPPLNNIDARKNARSILFRMVPNVLG